MSPLGKIHVLEVTDNAGHDEVTRSTLKYVGKLKNGDVSRVCVPLLRLHNRRTKASGKTGKSCDSPRSRSQHTESITRAPQMGWGAHRALGQHVGEFPGHGRLLGDTEHSLWRHGADGRSSRLRVQWIGGSSTVVFRPRDLLLLCVRASCSCSPARAARLSVKRCSRSRSRSSSSQAVRDWQRSARTAAGLWCKLIKRPRALGPLCPCLPPSSPLPSRALWRGLGFALGTSSLEVQAALLGIPSPAFLGSYLLSAQDSSCSRPWRGISTSRRATDNGRRDFCAGGLYMLGMLDELLHRPERRCGGGGRGRCRLPSLRRTRGTPSW